MPSIPGNTFSGGNVCEPKRWVDNYDHEQVADDCAAGKGSQAPLAQRIVQAAKVVADQTAALTVGCPAAEPLARNTFPDIVADIMLKRSTRWKPAQLDSPRILCYMFATHKEIEETVAVSNQPAC